MRIFPFLIILFLVAEHASAIEFDFSRRRKSASREPSSEQSPRVDTSVTFLDDIFAQSQTTRNQVVIMNTEEGFVPKNVRVQKGIKYTFYIVNVNQREKNVSFVMDDFAQAHATYFGQVRTFDLDPQKEGIFSYHCPETSVEGRLVVFRGEGIERTLSSSQKD